MHAADRLFSPRHLLAALGVALACLLAALAIAQAPHVQPVSSQEVDGALAHIGTLVAAHNAAPTLLSRLSPAGE